MKKEYVFKSMNDGTTIITINNGLLEIERSGIISKFSHGFSGKKSLLIKNISSIQVKEAKISRGYIQFSLAGSLEKKSGILKGKKDENIIYFDAKFNNKETNKNANEIKDYIEQYNSKDYFQNPEDNYDKLKKVKQLLDAGVINEEEFEHEKQKLLNN